MSPDIWKYKEVTEEQLLPYFETPALIEGLDIGIVSKALLPVRHFYKTYNDHTRLWLNEQSTPQELIRDDYEKQA